MELNKIYQGDCLKVMKTFPDNSIDTIITDPPAGIGFMGKKWDSDKGGRDNWIEWLTEVMKGCYRVAKPGSTALVWAIPRTSHWTATAIENAGWQIKDIIMHIYGSGFPKATDISKQLDKGVERKVIGHNLITPRQRERGTNKVEWTGALKKPIDNKVYGHDERNLLERMEITEPATPEAKLWNGWKSHGLKPAAEHWIVAQKPNDGTYANNALKWGVSGLNIDGGRIEPVDEKDLKEIRSERKTTSKGQFATQTKDDKLDRSNRQEVTGRFPANIILDEEAAKLLDEQSGESKSNPDYNRFVKNQKRRKKIGYGFGEKMATLKGHNDKGGASRFFYVAKASKSERNMGCEELEEKASQLNSGGIGRECSVEKRLDKHGINTPTMKNNHPTVKPLKLMEYLCKLTSTPTGGIVLDPFAGSGTTCMACKKVGRPYIGIEQDPEYVKIAEARIEAIKVDNKLF